MRRTATLLAALAAILTAAAEPVRTATENFVTNKVAEAVAAIPLPDYSTNNTALVETIEATAPAPGDYATVRNRAMNAVQTETDPTVPQWAKAATKPSYSAAEIGATTPADVTAAIREQSLGGIWDEGLQVWWTPVMRNGSLTYQATTNVNLNAEN